MRTWRWMAVWAVLLGLAGLPGVGHADEHGIVIATGGTGGVYYPVGRGICDLLNRGKVRHGLTCRADSTGGSVDNIARLRTGKANFAIVQADVLFYALNGYGPFRGQAPFAGLRSVLSLHPEAFTVLARRDSAIRTFADLHGKRVNVGNPGSGQRTFMELVMHVLGWRMSDFADALELDADQQVQALCDGRVDAIVYMVGHPNQAISTAAERCATRLVEVTDQVVRRMMDKYPYISPTVIPSRLYPGSSGRTRTFGVRAVLATTDVMSEQDVHAVTAQLFNGFIDLKFSHKALFRLEPKDMARKSTVPIHDGAFRFISTSTDLYKLMDVRPAR